MTQAADISLVLSGGTNNINPSLSIGGDPAALRIVSGNINNLFGDVSPDDSVNGLTDYRCVYLFNDGNSYVYNVDFWIQSMAAGSSDIIQVGIQQQDEVQTILLGGVPTGGSFVISYAGLNVTSTYQSDLGLWATNLQNSLRALVDSTGHVLLEDVVVAVQNLGNSLLFTVNFIGQNGSRNHDTLTLVSNTLVPSTPISINVLKQGSPVNTIAPKLDLDTTPPGGVVFQSPDINNPLSLPNLAPADGFPIWIKRTTPANAEAVSSDGFTMRIRMQSLHP